MKLKQPAKFNEHGKRVGDSHGRAKLSDHEVELIRRCVSAGELSRKEVCVKFSLSKGYVSKLCRFLKRASTVCEVREVSLIPKRRR